MRVIERDLLKSGKRDKANNSKIHVALLGVSHLVVVQTPDAILVCHRHDVEKIKNLVQLIPKKLQ